MKIKLAETVFEFDICNKKLLSTCENRYRGFFCHQKSDFTIKVKTARLKKNPSKVEIKNGRILRISRGDFNFILYRDKGFLETRPSIYSLDSFLRIFSSFLFPKKNIFLVHGALSHRNGLFFAFLGKSQAGKSTISSILEKKEFKILSDELFYLKAKGKKILFYSSPFWGQMKGSGEYACGRAKSIFLLRKSKKNFKKRAKFEVFLQTFLRCSMIFSKSKRDAYALSKAACLIFDILDPEILFFSKKGNSFVKLL